MILKAVLAIALSQAVRSKVDDRDPNSQCLWWPENTQIQVRLSADGNPETPSDTEFTAIVKAMQTWQTQLETCSSLSLTEGPRTQTRKVGYYDGETNENVAVFRLKRCSDVVPMSDPCKGEADNCGSQYDCWQHQEAAIAITTTSYNPETGRILDSDIEYGGCASLPRRQFQHQLRGDGRAEHDDPRARSLARPGPQPVDDQHDELPREPGRDFEAHARR